MTSFLESCHPRGFSGYILPSSSPKVSVGGSVVSEENKHGKNRFPNPASRQTLGNDNNNNAGLPNTPG